MTRRLPLPGPAPDRRDRTRPSSRSLGRSPAISRCRTPYRRRSRCCRCSRRPRTSGRAQLPSMTGSENTTSSFNRSGATPSEFSASQRQRERTRRDHRRGVLVGERAGEEAAARELRSRRARLAVRTVAIRCSTPRIRACPPTQLLQLPPSPSMTPGSTVNVRILVVAGHIPIKAKLTAWIRQDTSTIPVPWQSNAGQAPTGCTAEHDVDAQDEVVDAHRAGVVRSHRCTPPARARPAWPPPRRPSAQVRPASKLSS